MMRHFLLLFVLTLLPLSLSAEDKALSQEKLDQMLAPVALYPDALLSQMLMAATYPDQVKEAVAWSKKNDGKLKGDDAVTAVADKEWDPSVASLVAFPDVLDMMDKQSDWVKEAGDAFLNSPDEVMETIQTLRKKAKDEGNLKSSKEQKVEVEDANNTTTIIIEQAEPKTVYVPVYNPMYVYGPWWYPHYPPFYYYPPYYRPPSSGFFFGFTMGVVVGNCMWGGFRWGRGDVYINVNRYNSIHVNKKINVNGRHASWKNDMRGKHPHAPKAAKRDLQRSNAKKAMDRKGVDLKNDRHKLKGESGKKINQSVKKTQKQNIQKRQNLSKPTHNRNIHNFDRSNMGNRGGSIGNSRNLGGSRNFGGGGGGRMGGHGRVR